MGHATRCIPIIKGLLSLNCEVIIAATGDQKILLQDEFPLLAFLELPGYDIKYGKNRALTLLKIISSIPKILIHIKREKAWLAAFLKRERVDAVISDNRYGLYNKGVFSVFMTHQLLIRTGFGQRADRMLQRMQYRMLKRFSLCWVPDREENTEGNVYSLAGELSHPQELPVIPVRYIGLLSRFEKKKKGEGGEAQECDLLILLSGPEPQRTIFEKTILSQLGDYKGKTILVRGLPGEGKDGADEASRSSAGPEKDNPLAAGLIVYAHLGSDALNVIVCNAGLVLSRPGYSSVMDLEKLEKKCIFVPTPGQTEQEYLGAYLGRRRLALCLPQEGFSLAAAVEAAEYFPFARAGVEGSDLLPAAIGELIGLLPTDS